MRLSHGRAVMDFIETIFGVSPDGGSGATEALYIALVIVAVFAWVMRRPLRRAFLAAVSRKSV
jgi:hypothetical protein